MTDQDPLAEIRQRREAIGDGNWTYRPDIDPGSSKDVVENARRLEDGWVEQDSFVAYDEGVITDETGRFIAHAPSDIDWLIGEVERQREELDRLRAYLEDIDRHADKQKAAILLGAIKEKDTEVERLRGRLQELEWAGRQGYEGGADPACPVCASIPLLGEAHDPDCWLAAELRSTSP